MKINGYWYLDLFIMDKGFFWVFKCNCSVMFEMVSGNGCLVLGLD